MDIELGREAVWAARQAAEAETEGRSENPVLSEEFERHSGAFVTISKHPSGELRGCIGYPEPVFPLGEAIIEAARSACHDPRFHPLTPAEVAKCVFEVTVLTPPNPIEFSSAEELMANIEFGRDGLMISFRGRRGLLLPQVPVEMGWNKEEYLDHLSIKAGLPRDAWRNEDVSIDKFQGEIYYEVSPGGDVVRK
ncbi:MAG TPA: TIGR00296 family protein [Candidatus Methanomethylophilaceae archaeon]|nr:TIGR00296 family protein [Candidatus Methanomethylophilaceae archaeon]